MRILLDTCVLSEVRHPLGSDAVKAAFKSIADENVFISVITIGEIYNGIKLIEHGKRQQELSFWLESLEHYYKSQILAIDSETTKIWGEITALSRKSGKILAVTDGLIAATAIRHGLHVMTRNTKDFKDTGVLIVNPWED